MLPAAIEKSIFLGISKSLTNISKIVSIDKSDSFEFSISGINLFSIGSWKNYFVGIIEEIKKKNISIPNFQLVFFGNIPAGAGLSSSAALENAIVFALNELFDLGLSKNEMMLISQKAEHNYVGVKCGIMDQFASMMGKENIALFLDCKDLTFKEVPIESEEYEWLLINSNVHHELASSEYNTRRSECESVVSKIKTKYNEVQSLREVKLDQIEEFKFSLSNNEHKRSKYVVEENQRVSDIVEYIRNNEFENIGNVLFDAHEAMKNEYEITCKETDFLVQKAMKNENIIGARQVGGGFGGCTLNLVKKGKIEAFITEELINEYYDLFNLKFDFVKVKLGNGTQTIWKK